ncbi:MAG: MBL fold metallo-hydrolase [Boseongicola sp.]|nr:MBL fold metallo-hydrolase [Boseongicola sp.]
MEHDQDFNPVAGEPDDLGNGLRRIVAPNPSPMTFRGTNTYLLGQRDLAVIDPGPPDETHLAAILDALGAGQRISHIFVTHSHADHSPLAMTLAQITGAPIHAFGDSRAGRAAHMARFGNLGGGEGLDMTFMPNIHLSDGETISGSDWSLSALHTPGHMGNHLSFAWSEGQALFSGDLVMGWATSMVSPPDGDLTDFMSSLDRLSQRDQDQIYYPGHGDAIEAPQARVAALSAHRKSREAQIRDALGAGPASPSQIARAIYTDVSPRLLPAAERNVLAHLIDLTIRNVTEPQGEFAADAIFSLR